jgi:hypothetical protein
MEPPSSPSPVDFMDGDSGSFDVFGFVAAENYFSNLTTRKLFLEVEEGCISARSTSDASIGIGFFTNSYS